MYAVVRLTKEITVKKEVHQKKRAELEEAGETWANSFLDTVKGFKNEGKSFSKMFTLKENFSLGLHPRFNDEGEVAEET